MGDRTLAAALALALGGCGAANRREGSEKICDDGVDNDGNGRTDCSDPDCLDSGECPSRDASPDSGQDGGDVDTDSDSDGDAGLPATWGDEDADGVPDPFDLDPASAATPILGETFDPAPPGWAAHGEGKWGFTNDGEVVQTMPCAGYTIFGPQEPLARDVYLETGLFAFSFEGSCGPYLGMGLFVRAELDPGDPVQLHACLVETLTPGSTTLRILRIEGEVIEQPVGGAELGRASIRESLDETWLRMGFVSDGTRLACGIEGYDDLWIEAEDDSPNEGSLGLITENQGGLFDDFLAFEVAK